MEVRVGVLLLLLGEAQWTAADSGLTLEILNNTSGTIHAPVDSGGLWYKPNARHLWILDMQDSDINIEVSVDNVDLGLPYTTIHTNSTVNYTEGDFILVGAGSDILAGDEVMFFGSRLAPQRVVIRSQLGHIFFYSSESITNATGFTITYHTTSKVTTQPPSTTITTSVLTYTNTFVSIQGIPASNWSAYNDSFREAIAKTASVYKHPDRNMTVVNVDPADVLINDAKTCHPYYCPEDMCVAYNFSVAIEVDGEVAFSKGELEDMLADPVANKYIEDAYGQGCQICNESPGISTVSYVVIPITVVIFGVAFTVAAWMLTSRSSIIKAQKKYEQEEKDRIQDQRRRSSGDVSIIGLGGRSIASRGSRNSRRFTMPFPKPVREEGPKMEDEEGEEEVDTTGFVYYDPDLGISDTTQLGLRRVVPEFKLQSQGPHEYTNEAFVKDEESAMVLQQQPFGDDSDSTDSENGGALSFRPKRRELTPRIQFDVPADVHNPDAEGETNL